MEPIRTRVEPIRTRTKPFRTRSGRPGREWSRPGQRRAVPDTPAPESGQAFCRTGHDWIRTGRNSNNQQQKENQHGEAIDVATMLTHYWDPKTDTKGNTIPGFSGVAPTGSLTPEVATEIRELQLATAAAHSEYLVLVQGATAAPLDRADFVLGEIRQSLEFLFDDGKQDDADVQLEQQRQEFGVVDVEAMGRIAVAARTGVHPDYFALRLGEPLEAEVVQIDECAE